MFIVYDIIFALFAVLYFPCMIFRGKWHAGFKTRFGNLDSLGAKTGTDGPRLWIHAVSVGEVLAVVDLIRRIKEKFPQYAVVFSTVTKTGYQLANEQLGAESAVIYAPLDFSWVVRKFIKLIDPKIYISTETEIWPNLYTALCKKGVPIVQINGRISDKAYKGYQRVRFLTKRVLACVNIFCMQSALDAERIVRLGGAAKDVRVVGNMKFDTVPSAAKISKTDLGFREEDDLLIAGSTHPGEEDILIDVYRQLAGKRDRLRLIIAPRHVERAEALAELIETRGYKPIRFSQGRCSDTDAKSIVVVDTIGRLRELYSLATVVVIGKTFTVGVGQNMIEAASFGKPTVVGPLTQNFKDAMDIFLKAGALMQVGDAQGLLKAIDHLLSDPQRARALGEKAKETVARYQGATAKTLEAISEILLLRSG